MKKILVFIPLCIGVALGISFFTQPTKTYRVTLTERGFTPESLTIRKGDSVTFRTTVDRPFWPASNYHPTHGLYPAFDAKQLILPSVSWTFRFMHAGEWGYHDHSAPKYTGTIIVTDPWGWLGEKENPCQMKETSGTGGTNTICWIRMIQQTLKQKGLVSAFATFAQLYDSNKAFATNCHDVAHVLGAAAYAEFMKSGKTIITPETAYCGYGFYHGYIEALLRRGDDFQKARLMCESVQNALAKNIQSPQGKNSCYHGVGHGAFDAIDSNLWGHDEKMVDAAIAKCKDFVEIRGEGDEELFRLCTTGVFNALANAYQSKSYAITYAKDDPLRICRMQPPLLQKGCFMEIAVSFVRNMEYDRDASIRFFRSSGTQAQISYEMFAFMADEVRVAQATKRDITDLLPGCRWGVASVDAFCVEGIAYGLTAWGRPGHEWEDVQTFCMNGHLNEGERSICFATMIKNLGNMYSHEKVSSICAEIPAAYKKNCQL